MNFSGISSKSVLGRLLRLPLQAVPKSAILPIVQGKLQGYKWIAGSSNHGCWLGSYEYEKQQLIGKTVQPGTVAFDIGAHVGFYTLLFSELVGPKGQVFAFEPHPGNLEYLKRHLSINQVSNVQVVEGAVSDASGRVLFKQGPNSSMGHVSDSGDFEVEQYSLDALVIEGNLPVPHYMKIDIEGAEYKALNGARRILQQFHPVIFLATHGAQVHQDCCQFLLDLGYELTAISGETISDTDEMVASFSNGFLFL